MLAQDLAGEIERAADQDVVGRRLARRRWPRPRPATEPAAAARRAEPAARAAADASRVAARAPRRGSARSAGSPPAAAAAQEAGRDPWSSACRRRDAAAGPASRPGRLSASTWPAAGLWPPSSQSSCPAATSSASGPRAAAAAGPASAPRAGRGRSRRLVELASRSCSAASDGEPGIVDLMRADQRRPRQVEPAAPRSRQACRPCAVGQTCQSRPCSSSGAPISAARASITASASGCCGPITAGTPGLRMPAFSPAISASVSPR